MTKKTSITYCMRCGGWLKYSHDIQPLVGHCKCPENNPDINNMLRIKGILAKLLEIMYANGHFVGDEQAQGLMREINKIKED